MLRAVRRCVYCAKKRAGAILAIAVVLAQSAAAALGGDFEPEIGRLRAHVSRLASGEFAGRDGEGARKAAEYVQAEFSRLGLEPAFDGAWAQDVLASDGKRVIGRNVAGRIIGADEALRDEWIVLGVHFDHLGIRKGVMYPGADDNASSVAMMLETARCVAKLESRPKRGVMFVGFDKEESGLIGSRYFVAHPPVPLEKIKLFVTADLLGRSLGDVCGDWVFAFGAERAPALAPSIEHAAAGQPLKLGLLGTDLLAIDRSDYGPFRAKKVPYLFFSCGENPHYHQPNDTADTIDYPKLEAISRLVFRLTKTCLNADALPVWSADPGLDAIREAATVRAVLTALLDGRDALRLKPDQARLLSDAIASLDEALSRGVVTPRERARMVRTAQLVLYSIL